MRILVNHDGQQLGPYTLEEVRAAQQAGSLNADDLAWVEGTPSWVPLSSILEGPAPAVGGASPQYGAQPYASVPVEAPTSGLAIASLVLGILSFLCLSVFSAVPGIICGHIARSNIRNSQGRESGEGIALAGLICSYTHLVLVVVAIMAAILIPAFAAGRMGGLDAQTRMDARQIVLACISYANDHDGKYPASLEELESSAHMDTVVFHRPGSLGYDYFGAGKTAQSIEQPSTTPLLAARKVNRQGKRIIGYADGHVSTEVLSPEHEH